jgi:NAD(P)-dependent dehydrogenase (short-subunit alcohol dehydrogenase family)
MIYPDLKGKTVFVIGANGGIGFALVEELVQHECNVIALVRDSANNFRFSDLASIEVLNYNLSQREEIKQWLEDFENKGNKVDVLVNNAGVYEVQSLIDATEEDWDYYFDVNLRSAFFVAQLFTRHMKSNGGGTIINAASFAAKMASENMGLYATSKAALVSLTKSMAAEWAKYDIRVNCYSPGVIETQMTAPVIAKNKDAMLSKIAMKRFGDASEGVAGILFLMSNQSSYITGINLEIDGGKYLVQ